MQALPHDSQPPAQTSSQPGDVGANIARVLAGDQSAWPALIAQLHPMIIELCRHRLRGQTHAQEDICRDVASKTLERLQRADYAALRRYQDTRANYPALQFTSWIRVVVGNVCIDHLRTLPGHQRLGQSGARQHQIQATSSLREETAGSTDLQRNVEISRVLAWLSDPQFPSEQREALALWMRGHNAKEIAVTMKLSSPSDATRLLRAGRQRLRRRFEDC